jgi:CheY-like chemotaxis protein
MDPIQSAFTILIVDDDEGHIELVRRQMRRIAVGNPILPLRDGSRALDYVFRRGEFDGRIGANPLILLDINMPGSINGVDVLRSIKADPVTRMTPVIMLSTTDDQREVALCYVDSTLFIEAIKRLGLFLQIIRLAAANETSAEVPLA